MPAAHDPAPLPPEAFPVSLPPIPTLGDSHFLAASASRTDCNGPISDGNVARAVTSPRPLRRILHVINGEHYSGAERVQDLLALRLPQEGYQVGFACVKPGRFADCRQAIDASVFACGMRSRFDFRVVGQLVDLVKAEGYELLHAHTPRSVMVARLVANRLGLPLVYHVHSPTARDSSRAWANRINALTERLSLSGVARLITVSESLAAHMRSLGFLSDLISVVPNGVPVVAQRAVRSAPTAEWTLGTIALFRPRKGTEILLHALAQLRAEGMPVRLRAVGGWETTEYEQHLRELTARLQLEGAVDWVGFQRDVNRQLEQIDLFVLPSLYGEGMPMVVLEAMAMGIPVVGTRVEGVPEVIRDGLDGRIAEPGDAADLAGAIRSIVEADFDWHSMSQSVLDRHATYYSDRSMARGVASIYDALLKVKPTRNLPASGTDVELNSHAASAGR